MGGGIHDDFWLSPGGAAARLRGHPLRHKLQGDEQVSGKDGRKSEGGVYMEGQPCAELESSLWSAGCHD